MPWERTRRSHSLEAFEERGGGWGGDCGIKLIHPHVCAEYLPLSQERQLENPHHGAAQF